MNTLRNGSNQKGNRIGKDGVREPAAEPIRSGSAESQEAKIVRELRTAMSKLTALANDLGISIPDDKMKPISDAMSMLEQMERKKFNGTDMSVCAAFLGIAKTDISDFLRKSAGYMINENDAMFKPLSEAAAFLNQKVRAMW